MGEIIFSRPKNMDTMLMKLECWVDGDLAAVLKNGEKAVYSTEKNTVIFHCQYRTCTPLPPVTLDLTDCGTFKIVIEPGGRYPKASYYKDGTLYGINQVLRSGESFLCRDPEILRKKRRCSPTKTVRMLFGLDEEQELWAPGGELNFSWKMVKSYEYKDLLSFELEENGHTVTTGGLGSAAIGGILLGPVGAVVGGITGRRTSREICKDLRIKIVVDSFTEPVVYIRILSSATKKTSFTYRQAVDDAQKILAMLEIIANCNQKRAEMAREKQQREEAEARERQRQAAEEARKSQQEEGPVVERRTYRSQHSGSPLAEELRSYKQLLDEGILSQEEFDQLKKKLLDL